MWWIFVHIVTACMLIIGFVIAGFVLAFNPGAISTGFIHIYPPLNIPFVYPPWLVESMLAFFWFSAVFSSLKRKFCDVTHASYLWELAPIIGKLLIAHIFLSVVLRVAFNLHLLLAYGGGWLVAVYIPMQIVIYRYPKKKQRLEETQLTAEKLKKITQKSQAVQAFLDVFPSASFYVIDNAVKHKIATCVLMHRQLRKERDRLYEDITLEIPVDLKKRTPLDGKAKVSRYIFQSDEAASAVVELPDLTVGQLSGELLPIDDFTLDKLDASFSRYPSLHDLPLPIATRQGTYQTA